MDILTPSGCGIHNFESAPCSTSKETKDQIEKGCKDLEFVTFANEQKKEDMLIDKGLLTFSRKEKRKNLKKIKRKEKRKELAEKVRADELIRLQDPEEQAKLYLQEQAEAEAIEMEKNEREEQEKLWLEREQKAMQEVAQREEAAVRERECRKVVEDEEEEGYEYVEDGPAEIIWEGNEITLKKKKVKVKKNQDVNMDKNIERPTSNPLPPQSAVFATPSNPVSSLYEALEQIPNFGTEQDKTHCPFHIKTGACRFGIRCSRAHVYPEKSCTLLLKNMYNGPGLLWEHDEGLESTDEEVAEKYEEFYEDVHSEFLKFGELINFKVCRNGSAHLRGNVYVHYREEESAIEAQRYMNARFFGGKQITCEFVGVTRWKIAICGEYMKAHHKVCSHGTACNFLHCFRNPGGEYDWADWDAPPPRSWKLKMANLFGYKVEYVNQHDDRRKGDQQENGRNKGGSSFQSHHSHYTKRDNGIRRSKPQRTSWGYAELDEKYNSSRDDKEEAHRKTSRRRNYDLYGNGATYSDSDNEKERIERRRKQKRASASSISKRPESNVSRYSDSDNEKGWHRESKGARKRSKTPHSSTSESASEDGKDDHKDTKHNSNSREMRVSKRRPEELHKQKQSKSQKYRSGREDDAVRLLSSRDKKRRYRVEAQRDEDLDVSDRWQGSP